jgi:hypothetical protein
MGGVFVDKAATRHHRPGESNAPERGFVHDDAEWLHSGLELGKRYYRLLFSHGRALQPHHPPSSRADAEMNGLRTSSLTIHIKNDFYNRHVEFVTKFLGAR